MASTTPNGSYLQQADPQNFPANATGAPPPNSYQTTHTPAQADQPTQSQEVPKDEVGWYFVEQYYTTLNKTPDRLHLFYNKRSSMVWGTEGESLPLARGRPEIQEKIAAHEFKDCKVRVSNVDSQASATGGIVIQVLGEMSNNGLPNRKFSQTFFLAEQPNGYYVLNDIFRYLKDDDDIEEGDEYDDYVEEVVAEAVPEAVEVIEEVIEEVQDPSVKETTTAATTIEPAASEGEPKIEEIVAVEPAPTAEPEPAVEETPAPANESVEPVAATEEPVAKPEEKVEIEEAAPVPAEPEEAAEEPVPAPVVVEEKPAPAPVKEIPPVPRAPVPAPAPAPPKSWASLVATPVAPAAQPVAASTAPAAAPAPVATAAAAPAAAPAPVTAAPAAPAAPAPPVAPTTPTGGSQWQTADSKRHSRVSSTPVGQTQAYVKNVTEAVTEKALKDALTKFGNLKHFEISRIKNCAFVEFDTPAAFSAANTANPHSIAGSNVLVEERRRPATPYGGRGGMSNRGDGRSSGQGGRGYPRDGQRFEGGRGGRGSRSGFGGRGGSGGSGGGVKTTATTGN